MPFRHRSSYQTPNLAQNCLEVRLGSRHDVRFAAFMPRGDSMTTSIDRQAGPNTDHNRADFQGRVRLEIAPEEPLLSGLECDIIECKFVSLLCFAP